LALLPLELERYVKTFLSDQVRSKFVSEVRKHLINRVPELYILNYRELPSTQEIRFISLHYDGRKYRVSDKTQRIVCKKPKYSEIVYQPNKIKKFMDIDLSVYKKRKLSKREYMNRKSKKPEKKHKSKEHKVKRLSKLFSVDLVYQECENCYEMVCNTYICDYCYNEAEQQCSISYISYDYDYSNRYGYDYHCSYYCTCSECW
jgi:hypothetical protein